MCAKTYITLLVAGIGLLLGSCQKNTDGEGSLMITVRYKGTAVANAAVYIKKGALTNPGLSPDQYDWTAITASDGRVTLTGVKPDNYFLHARAYIASESRYAEGDDSLIVRQRFRQNIYDVTIETH